MVQVPLRGRDEGNYDNLMRGTENNFIIKHFWVVFFDLKKRDLGHTERGSTLNKSSGPFTSTPIPDKKNKVGYKANK